MKYWVSFLTLILLTPMIFSFNFGVTPKNDRISVVNGETGHFTLLFWNLGDDSYSVNIIVKDIPKDWDVIIKSKDFYLNPTPISYPPYTEGEYLEIPGKGNVKTETVKVFVKVPKNSQPGEYKIVLLIKAGDLKNEISVFQEREISLKVLIKGNEEKENEISKPLKIISSAIKSIFQSDDDLNLENKRGFNPSDDKRNKITGYISKINLSWLAIILGMIIITSLIIFFIFNKKSLTKNI
ncbi:MAG: hypothetical protein QXY45_03050 [Candidatus Aenigmatarchaeota archaeon]